MPINQEDIEILKLSKGIKEGSNIPKLIAELREQSIEMLIEGSFSLEDCYPELTHDDSSITMTVYKRVKN